jgi:hypothetical protein
MTEGVRDGPAAARHLDDECKAVRADSKSSCDWSCVTDNKPLKVPLSIIVLFYLIVYSIKSYL